MPRCHVLSVNSVSKSQVCTFLLLVRYGFGSEGNLDYKVGPDKDVLYEVTLKDFKRVSFLLSMVTINPIGNFYSLLD